jgi:hypothetical protein
VARIPHLRSARKELEKLPAKLIERAFPKLESLGDKWLIDMDVPGDGLRLGKSNRL